MADFGPAGMGREGPRGDGHEQQEK
jgi:hypothetical protein